MTSEGMIIFEVLQPPGKKPIPGPAFLLGARHWVSAG
jgi:methionyl-tRNA formyltransferase